MSWLQPVGHDDGILGVRRHVDDVGAAHRLARGGCRHDLDLRLLGQPFGKRLLPAGRGAVDLDLLQGAERGETMRRAFGLPAGPEQCHDARVLAGQILRAHGAGAGDAKLLQKAVVDDRQQFAGARAVEIDQAAEVSVSTARHAPLQQPVAVAGNR